MLVSTSLTLLSCTRVLLSTEESPGPHTHSLYSSVSLTWDVEGDVFQRRKKASLRCVRLLDTVNSLAMGDSVNLGRLEGGVVSL